MLRIEVELGPGPVDDRRWLGVDGRDQPRASLPQLSQTSPRSAILEQAIPENTPGFERNGVEPRGPASGPSRVCASQRDFGCGGECVALGTLANLEQGGFAGVLDGRRVRAGFEALEEKFDRRRRSGGLAARTLRRGLRGGPRSRRDRRRACRADRRIPASSARLARGPPGGSVADFGPLRAAARRISRSRSRRGPLAPGSGPASTRGTGTGRRSPAKPTGPNRCRAPLDPGTPRRRERPTGDRPLDRRPPRGPRPRANRRARPRRNLPCSTRASVGPNWPGSETTSVGFATSAVLSCPSEFPELQPPRQVSRPLASLQPMATGPACPGSNR